MFPLIQFLTRDGIPVILGAFSALVAVKLALVAESKGRMAIIILSVLAVLPVAALAVHLIHVLVE